MSNSTQPKRFSSVITSTVLVLLLLVLGGIVWAKFFDHGDPVAEKKAFEKLRDAKVLVIAEPPDQKVTSVTFTADQTDEALLQQVPHLYRLVAVNAANTKIGDDQMKIFVGLSNLASLVLGETQITDAGIAQLKGLQSMEALHLPGTQITDASLPHIVAMRNLKVLDLSRTKVTDAGLKQLATMANVRWLLLADDAITDAGLESLATMKDLKRLTLNNTKVTSAGVARLKKTIPMLSVDVSEAPAEGGKK